MKDGNVEEALQSFENYKKLHGLPEPRVLNSMIVSLSYMSSRRWLQRVFDVVLSIHQINSNLLNCDSLMKLALALARDHMPVPAYTVLRIILESGKLPDVDMLSMVFLHMLKLQKQGVIQIGFGNLKIGYRIMFDPGKVDRGFILGTESQFRLVVLTDGNLLHTEKALAKLIVGCVKSRNMHTLSNLFIMLYKEDIDVDSLPDVVNACIQMGWLHDAHDIIDDLESAGIQVGIPSYISLLRVYEKENKSEEFNGLLQQIQKIASTMDDFRINSPFAIKNIAKIVKDEILLTHSPLFPALAEEMKHYNPGEHFTLEFNNSIIFFCEAKMMEDALCTYKRMGGQNIRPTSYTFCHILCGYSSMDMHREITMLWVEIKHILEYGELDVDRDLLDFLILNFLKGGYFSRVMEVIDYMSKHNIYCNKWKYRHVFLKLHMNLYRI
ncbi:hypothetical protein C2845_PM03G07570 [Panicum miliaceum]|uniref:At1g68980-like TPR repeats domain-containing protein n=1 Tax=Panicum miliaceum TaxID=4540 RepID=A0A3L6TFZ1_PANMI|nr:hypothetical protein C2845_PM03G07570 [Panicum miliaceum]